MYEDAFADDMEFEEEIGDNDDVVSEDEEMEMELGDIGPIEGLPGDVDVEIELDESEDPGSDDESQEEEEEEDDDDEEEEDDDDDDDEMARLEALGVLEGMEEVTGDDENGSLADDHEDSWSGDNGDFSGGGDPNLPTGTLGFVLDPPQLLEQMRQGGDLEDFIDNEIPEDEGKSVGSKCLRVY